MHDSSRIDYSSTLRSNDSLTLINEEIRRKKLNSGYVEAIELFDFMCHRHLLIRLNPGVNFIVGNNGSGKSAILTGLIIALGSRAGATQRAASIESLVREGASASRVKVKLYNGGNNPFAPDIYGEHIIVERCIRRGGSGSYHIYNSNNRLVTSRKEDISLICDHFGIQVDNPLAVLTQEVAKKFLANARPKELYEVNATLDSHSLFSPDVVFFESDTVRTTWHRLHVYRRENSRLENSIRAIKACNGILSLTLYFFRLWEAY